MNVSQKCQYALRGIYELAVRYGRGVVRIGEIATAQAIPPRFLELILNQLRQGGFVESRRGVQGGYMLAVSPEELTVGEIIRFIDGPLAPVKCVAGEESAECPLYGSCAFLELWQRARDAVAEVYDSMTFKDLVDRQRASAQKHAANYCI
jgi:Rrf2 family protein